MAAPVTKTATLLSPIPAALDPWNTTAAAPLSLTYQYAGNTQPGDLTFASFSGWTAMSTAQMAAVDSVLQEIKSIVNVNFVKVTGTADPDMNLGLVSFPAGTAGQGGFQYSYTTNGAGQVTSRTLDDFAVWSNTFDITTQANRGTLFHEIGHALTLKHPGAYDVGGNIPPGPYLPAAEDNNRFTVMSYNAADNGLISDHLMLYDIAALQARFGANMTTRTGNDTYTGSTTENFSIWDAGGTDTISGSAFSTAETINLNEGTFSSVGATNNLSIAYGVTIENATGGAGNDTFILSSANVNNVINGGGGSDTAYVTYNLGSGYTLAGTALNFTMTGAAGTDTFQQVEFIHFATGETVATSTLIPNTNTNRVVRDFSGDARSDILWRGAGGEVAVWNMNSNQVIGGGSLSSQPGSFWTVGGTGDFNGDGKSDILWRGNDGSLSIWNLNGNQVLAGGGFISSQPGAFWSVAGTADFNGDGKADILLRGNDGAVAIWNMNNTTLAGGGYLSSQPGSFWSVAGTGDFNGDGKADILWRGADGALAIWDMNGNQLIGGGFLSSQPGSFWSVAGTGDFNGDGKSDVLLRGADGAVAIWDMNGNQVASGGFISSQPGSYWTVASTGDFNGDAKSDILWRGQGGEAVIWNMNNTAVLGGGGNLSSQPGSYWTAAKV